MFSRLRSLFRAWAIPGWIFFLWEAVDHISRLDFAISKGTTAVRALLSFLSAHPGLRLIVGIAWLTLVVMWPKDPTKRRNMEAGISASLETPQLEISLVQTSDEFGRVFSDFGESLTAYFTVVDEFLDNQLAVASWRLDQLSEDIRE